MVINKAMTWWISVMEGQRTLGSVTSKFFVKFKMLKIQVSHQVIFYLAAKEPTNLQSFKALCH